MVPMAGGVNMSISEYLSLAQMLLHFLLPTTTRFERWLCHRVVQSTTLRPRQQKSKPFWLAIFWCRWPESNRHEVAFGRFWVCCVCQFHHIGIIFATLFFLVTKIYYHKKLYLAIILSKFIHLLNGYEHRLIVFVLHQMVHP